MHISNLSVSLGDKPLFSNVSLIIKPGSLHIIMGSNGSGKSSLAATLMGHPSYTVTQGSITLLNEVITDVSPDKRALKGLYLAMQYPPTLPGITVLTFLQEAYRALKKPTIPVMEFTKLVENALNTVNLPTQFMYRSVHDGFSGGEKKRLELAQIIVLQPTTIILDEIDSGLDAAGIVCVQNVIAHIRTIQPHTSFLIITHNSALAQALNPDFIHTMQNGILDTQRAL